MAQDGAGRSPAKPRMARQADRLEKELEGAERRCTPASLPAD